MDNNAAARLEWPQDENQSPEDMYLELMKRVLTGLVRPQLYARSVLPADIDISPEYQSLKPRLEEADLEVVKRVPAQLEDRVGGVEWIPDGDTMVGLYRLDNVQKCIHDVIKDGVPGDFIETGVWRGGTCIFARACYKAYGDTERRIWLADSFKGLPPPDANKYPADIDDEHHKWKQLAIPRSEVEGNFEKYGLLDDRVKFLEGWFKDTLPTAPIEKIAVLRLDGDMYESTMDAITALYPKLSPGGYAIIDDYLWHKPCAQAIEDYRKANGITEPIIEIDRAGVYWRRNK